MKGRRTNRDSLRGKVVDKMGGDLHILVVDSVLVRWIPCDLLHRNCYSLCSFDGAILGDLVEHVLDGLGPRCLSASWRYIVNGDVQFFFCATAISRLSA